MSFVQISPCPFSTRSPVAPLAFSQIRLRLLQVGDVHRDATDDLGAGRCGELESDDLPVLRRAVRLGTAAIISTGSPTASICGS